MESIMSNPQICEKFLIGGCLHLDSKKCPQAHVDCPYLWQIFTEGCEVWVNVKDNELIEEQYCDPGKYDASALVNNIFINGTRSDNIKLKICFHSFCAELLNNQLAPNTQQILVRRLSTESLHVPSRLNWHRQCALKCTADAPDSQPIGTEFLTQWQWFYMDHTGWTLFSRDQGTPPCTVIEAKYQSSQEAFRFYIQAGSWGTEVRTCLLNYKNMTLFCSETQKKFAVIRRPKFLSTLLVKAKMSLPVPHINDVPSCEIRDEHWFPMDSQVDYELVPLNPESDLFQAISKNVTEQISNIRMVDIFRIQNSFLLQKYKLKKAYMERFNRVIKEFTLYHGTSDNNALISIFTQNFDTRMSGKNGTHFGQGIYFARDPKFSHRYTNQSGLCWMFVVRVLVGQSVLGRPGYRRPPPITPGTRPYTALFDSCVNNTHNPSIFVIFDNDQCYPDYVICYECK